VRFSDDFLDDPITALTVRIGDPIQQRVLLRIFRQMVEIAPLLMAERLAIGDEELQIADVGRIGIREIHLIDDAMAQREPEL